VEWLRHTVQYYRSGEKQNTGRPTFAAERDFYLSRYWLLLLFREADSTHVYRSLESCALGQADLTASIDLHTLRKRWRELLDHASLT
jgi:hypothetical protein